MAHQVVWTKKVTLFFEEHANLNEFQRSVLETRIAGMTVTQQAFYHNCSEATIARCIKRLKALYDEVQKEYPEELKQRKNSADELYMDEH